MSAIPGPGPVPLQDLLRDLGERRAEIRRLQTLVDRLGELLLEAWKERDRVSG